jgi:hypothetical protein
MENKQESRIVILDRLSKKYGKHFEVDTFEELIKLCDTTTVVIVVRLAMQEYERQGTKSMYSKSEVAKLIRKFNDEVTIGATSDALFSIITQLT